jgi:hypothetical protein
MSEKIDKFAIFSKKFAELDEEEQDKLVTAAHELLKIHRGIKDMSDSPSYNADIKGCFTHSVFNDDTKNFTNCRSTLVDRLDG